MAMLKICGQPGCGTLTLGALCIEHERPPAERLDRARLRAVPALATGSRARRHVPGASGRRPRI
jgi:hypothetical protein